MSEIICPRCHNHPSNEASPHQLCDQCINDIQGESNHLDIPNVKITAEPHPGIKCPRCRNMHGIETNPEQLCDRCVHAILTDLAYLVSEGRVTKEEAIEFRLAVQNSVKMFQKAQEI